ncbi:succinyl-diaminopimelate desuccinylase [Bacillus canaveralius]|uniref:Succinyl-diaminopimelate desuccinylase n=1 Tax=Bacillus canaveralius TaxID=1403243 RepID=A0A2N5GFZ9_9BACI|nr:ArgE/DapE family deacylase [Bacillus canaveralius]PLR79689.1 succinyl-diaminopimelate desuccinylase [Bacillus canaveralius]PLR91989.1 succinyl-diaminopimelate desuccinylase [Bacillus canaveralius]
MIKELLKELILIDSSNREGANQAVTFCAQWLHEHGLKTEIIENNGYRMAVCEIGRGEKTIVFNGHVDVVRGRKEQYIPAVEDGRLYGRGAADMKAGVAAMMCILVQIKDDDIPYKIQLQIVSDEEDGGLNCSGYLVENGYRGDFVICSEPTQLGIAIQAKGVLRLDIELRGKSAHGSRPWEGINAIEKAWQVYSKILELPFTKESSAFYKAPSINLAKISGGEAYNKVPDLCTLSLDIRYLPTQNKDEIVKEIEAVTDGDVFVNLVGSPVHTKDDDPFVSNLRSVVEKHANRQATIFGQHGSADTVFFSHHGIPAIEFGPSGANWHGDDEYVEIDSIKTYQQILIDFVTTPLQ